MKSKFKLKRGQALVEMMVGMALAAAIMPALITSFFAARGGTAQEQVRMQANARLRETREVLRALKDNSWSSITTNGTYHISQSVGTWSLASGAESGLDNLFIRQIIIGDAYRTPTGGLSILASGNTIDPSVKHVNISVTWTSPIASTVVSDYYLMRLENQTYVETLFADFSNANVIHRSTIATNVSGGEVKLDSIGTGVGDWCNPSLVLQALDLEGQGITTGLSAVQEHAYATTGNNASGHALYSVDITNPTPPTLPSASQGAFYDPTPQRKTYGLFATPSYIYATTDHTGITVDVINATTLTHTGSYNPGGNVNGVSVYVSGTIGYVTSATKLYAFNLGASMSAPPTLVSMPIAGVGNRVVVVGNYAYVATNNTTKQLQIFDISNILSGSMPEVGSINLGNSRGAVDVYVDSLGNYAYLATTYASPDFFVIDLATKSSPTVVGTYTTSSNMDPKGVTVISQDNRAIIVGSGADLYQVLNISVPSSPARCSPQISFPGVSSITAISSVIESDGDAYSYLLTNDASKEFQMIQGGPGGGGGGSTKIGVFDSQPFTPVSTATFNYFDANTTFPSGTYARYQIAVSNKVGGSCSAANYTFVGPGLDQTTWFTGSSTIPTGSSGSYVNPGECFRYRVSLSTDSIGTTPIFNDITVNYSL